MVGLVSRGQSPAPCIPEDALGGGSSPFRPMNGAHPISCLGGHCLSCPWALAHPFPTASPHGGTREAEALLRLLGAVGSGVWTPPQSSLAHCSLALLMLLVGWAPPTSCCLQRSPGESGHHVPCVRTSPNSLLSLTRTLSP